MYIDAPAQAQEGALRRLWKEAFGDGDAFLDAFFTTAFSKDRCLCVTCQGHMAAALYWFDCILAGKKIAYLYGVATAKAFRGQGLCKKLMGKTHDLMQDRGYAATVLVPGQESLFRFYGAMGYRPCSPVGYLQCTAGDAPVALRSIDAQEYGTIRRGLLPPGGVVQEEENLTFLQTQLQLYAGEHFLLSARCESGVVSAMELLGNTAKAPGIVKALGCDRGRFRVLGKKEYAMYYPFEDIEAPGYFGLAFD